MTKLSLVRGGWLQKGTFNWLKVICVRYDKEDKIENNKKKNSQREVTMKSSHLRVIYPSHKILRFVAV